jgi:hypothetical protein
MDENVPDTPTTEPASAADLADLAIADAQKAGIFPNEISEEFESVFSAILDALAHRHGDLAE